MNENKLVQKFFKQINKIIDYKLNKLTQIKSAIVHSINQNGTVNLIIPPDKTVYHNIQNQSIYQNLKVGDNVKIIKENNSLSNMWIIGGFGLSVQDNDNIDNKFNIKNNRNTISDVLNLVYPIGSIYMSVNNVNPTSFLGGTWESWGSGKVPVGVDVSDANFDTVEKTGGEKTHSLTVSEIPSHEHTSNGIPVTKTEGGYVAMRSGTFSNFSTDIISETNTTGGSFAHNNLQPYITCYMWKRVI